MKTDQSIIIPVTVPLEMHQKYRANYEALTKSRNHRLFLFAFDHKLEHLQEDFYQSDHYLETINPQLIFEIAAQSSIGALATHLGLIARYARGYPTINYIVKITGKTILAPTNQENSFSAPLNTVNDLLHLQKASAQTLIRGIGITIYLGTISEGKMLSFAAQQIVEAHKHGLIAILWIYYRGKQAERADCASFLVGAAGLANCLGADFVKVKPPKNRCSERLSKDIQNIVKSAGNTGVLFSGGQKKPSKNLIEKTTFYLLNGAAGIACGRNIVQRAPNDAIKLINDLAHIIYK